NPQSWCSSRYRYPRALDRRNLASPFIRLAITGPNHIVNLLEALAALRPAFNNLNAVEIAGSRIFDSPQHECRCLGSARGERQIPAPRPPFRIPRLPQVCAPNHFGRVLPPTKEAPLVVGATDPKVFLALHRVENGFAGVFFPPNPCQSRRVFQTRV